MMACCLFFFKDCKIVGGVTFLGACKPYSKHWFTISNIENTKHDFTAFLVTEK